jgi:hypothetical protein
VLQCIVEKKVKEAVKMLFQKGFFNSVICRNRQKWNDSIVKNVEITSENCHTFYGKVFINMPVFIEKVNFSDKKELKEALLTLDNGIEFRINYNGNVVIPLEQSTSNKILLSLSSFLKEYIHEKMYYLLKYRYEKRQKHQYSRYGMSDELIEAVTTLLITTNFAQIEPAMRVLVKNFLDHPSTWSFDGHGPIYYQNSCFSLLVDYGTAYWFNMVSLALDPFEKVKKIEKDIFAVKEEPNLREKVLSILNDKVIYMDYPKTEEIKGGVKMTPEETFREFCIELLSMLLSVVTDVFNDHELISLSI